MLVSGPISFYHLKGHKNNNVFLFGDFHLLDGFTVPNTIKFDKFLYYLFNTNNKFDLIIESSSKSIQYVAPYDTIGLIHKLVEPLNYNEKFGYYDCKYKNINVHGCFFRNKNWMLLTKNKELNEINEMLELTTKISSFQVVGSQSIVLRDIVNRTIKISKFIFSKFGNFLKINNITNYNDLINFFIDICFSKIDKNNNIDIIKSCMLSHKNKLIVENLITDTIHKKYDYLFDEIRDSILKLQSIFVDTYCILKTLESTNNVIINYGDDHIKEIYNKLIQNGYTCEFKYEMNFLDNKYIRTIDIGNSFNDLFKNI